MGGKGGPHPRSDSALEGQRRIQFDCNLGATFASNSSGEKPSRLEQRRRDSWGALGCVRIVVLTFSVALSLLQTHSWLSFGDD